jgi:hypothetical protein
MKGGIASQVIAEKHGAKLGHPTVLINMHPGRKPCALQWQWYTFITNLYTKLRGRFFPRVLRMYPDRSGLGTRVPWWRP